MPTFIVSGSREIRSKEHLTSWVEADSAEEAEAIMEDVIANHGGEHLPQIKRFIITGREILENESSGSSLVVEKVD